MKGHHERTALQKAVQAIHCLSKIAFRLLNDHIKQLHESFQDIWCENPLSQNLVPREEP